MAPARLLLALLLALGLAAADDDTALVYLFRHAECNMPACGVHLCRSGISRARYLPSLFAGAGGRRTLRPPLALYALDPSRAPYFAREYETFIPLASSLNLTINATFGRGDEARLAASILDHGLSPGAATAVCWRHTQIGAVAAALGCTPSMSGRCVPYAWPTSDYTSYLVLELGVLDRSVRSVSVLPMAFTPLCDTPSELALGACTSPSSPGSCVNATSA